MNTVILPLGVQKRLNDRALASGFLFPDGSPDIGGLLDVATEVSAVAHGREECLDDLYEICRSSDTDLACLARSVAAARLGRSYVQWPIATAHYMPPAKTLGVDAWHVAFTPHSPSQRAWLN